jgi:hypothetical protein
MTTPITTKYHTTDWSDYNATLKKHGSLLIWIDKDMVWYQKPTGKRGKGCILCKILFIQQSPQNVKKRVIFK